MRWTLFIALVLSSVVLCSCGSGEPDYSKVQAQTGGQEQGEWRDKEGTLLSLDSGKYTYEKDNGVKSSGTYKVANGQIALTGDGGTSLTATWPDANSPVTIEGESLTKTD